MVQAHRSPRVPLTANSFGERLPEAPSTRGHGVWSLPRGCKVWFPRLRGLPARCPKPPPWPSLGRPHLCARGRRGLVPSPGRADLRVDRLPGLLDLRRPRCADVARLGASRECEARALTSRGWTRMTGSAGTHEGLGQLATGLVVVSLFCAEDQIKA